MYATACTATMPWYSERILCIVVVLKRQWIFYKIWWKLYRISSFHSILITFLYVTMCTECVPLPVDVFLYLFCSILHFLCSVFVNHYLPFFLWSCLSFELGFRLPLWYLLILIQQTRAGYLNHYARVRWYTTS